MPGMITLTQQHVDSFDRDGFVIIERVLTSSRSTRPAAVSSPCSRASSRPDSNPDEWNWRMGRDVRTSRARSAMAGRSTLRSRRSCSTPMLARPAHGCGAGLEAGIGQDNVIWKPPGTKLSAFTRTILTMDGLNQEK